MAYDEIRAHLLTCFQSHPMENADAESEQLQPIVGHVSMVTDMVKEKKKIIEWQNADA
jgi:hypothetical protein